MSFFTKLADNLDQWKAYGAKMKQEDAARNAQPVKPMMGPDPKAQRMVGPSPIKPAPPGQNPATQNSPALLAAAKVFNNQQAAAKGQPVASPGGGQIAKLPPSGAQVGSMGNKTINMAPAPKPAPALAAPPPRPQPGVMPAQGSKTMPPLAKGPSAMPKTAFAEGFDKAAKVLTTKARNAIPKKEFAIPDEGKFPIHDRAHAANAKARASGTPYEARVNAAVHKKYPDMGEK